MSPQRTHKYTERTYYAGKHNLKMIAAADNWQELEKDKFGILAYKDQLKHLPSRYCATTRFLDFPFTASHCWFSCTAACVSAIVEQSGTRFIRFLLAP